MGFSKMDRFFIDTADAGEFQLEKCTEPSNEGGVGQRLLLRMQG